jgi:hypothetical protein
MGIGTDDTGLEFLSYSGAEFTAGHTQTYTDRQNKDITYIYR